MQRHSRKLITDVRANLLKHQLNATSEQNKKQFLLRTKTDLLIQKHDTKVVVAELLRVIELELDLLVQLKSLPKKTIPKADYLENHVLSSLLYLLIWILILNMKCLLTVAIGKSYLSKTRNF